MTSKEPKPKALDVEGQMNGEVTATGVGDLYLGKSKGEERKFVKKATDATVHIVRCQGYKSWLTIWDSKGEKLLKQEVSHALNLTTSLPENAMVWTFIHGGVTRLWSFKFWKVEEMKSCVRKMRVGMWERERKEEFKELKEEDQRAVDGGDMEMEEDYDTDDEEDVEEVYQLGRQFAANYTKDRRPMESKVKEKNSFLEVGMATDRAFVIRGSQIGVFSGGKAKDDVSFLTKIDKVRDSEGSLFSPEKVFLHDKDTKMILLPPGDRQKAFVMDLNRGEVCEEWQGPEDFQIGDLTSGFKFGSITGEHLVAGVNSNTVFRMDPRISKKSKLADSKVYKTNYRFGCLTTNEHGNLAVGSEKGEIRLYSEANKIAKCAFPGLGDKIKGVDTTADGKWVLATCKNYLLLYNVLAQKGHTGFQKRLLKDEKPRPLKLHILPEDMARFGITTVDFTIARFSVGENEEQMICTSTGNFLIVWSFKAIKQNAAKARFSYRIKTLKEMVVGEKFHFNSNKMVVSTQEDVMMQCMDAAKSKPRRRRTDYT
eukprot:CAMPEP_0184494166 /NCGR_PEP_ID=MMETSP0113_2-20130426/28036_1 /TAXON_ID=91329 /ORGANISM="Norrisiella sphaerica, Strain BC52" /LENGTH=539 /DNA_ID=CAMNT_0026879803 /DNA_START=12 /DNA_END=1631 /DNA_ORIENTATION=-